MKQKVYLWIALVAVGFLLGLLFPRTCRMGEDVTGFYKLEDGKQVFYGSSPKSGPR